MSEQQLQGQGGAQIRPTRSTPSPPFSPKQSVSHHTWGTRYWLPQFRHTSLRKKGQQSCGDFGRWRATRSVRVAPLSVGGSRPGPRDRGSGSGRRPPSTSLFTVRVKTCHKKAKSQNHKCAVGAKSPPVVRRHNFFVMFSAVGNRLVCFPSTRLNIFASPGQCPPWFRQHGVSNEDASSPNKSAASRRPQTKVELPSEQRSPCEKLRSDVCFIALYCISTVYRLGPSCNVGPYGMCRLQHHPRPPKITAEPK